MKSNIDNDKAGWRRPDEAGFHDLLRRAFDGELSESEFAALEKRLLTNPDERLRYLEYASLCVTLCQHGEEAMRSLYEDAPRRPEVESTTQAVVPPGRRGRQFRRLAWPAAGGLAILLVLLNVWSGSVDDASQSQAIAWIDRTNDAAPWIRLRAGSFVEAAGNPIRICFGSGVDISLLMGGSLEIISDHCVRLRSGQMKANVGASGRGFKVLTETADVLDLGTVFGVGVSPTNETDVVVFEGEVELDPRLRHGAALPREERYLNSGEAIRLQADGARARIPMIWHDPESLLWSSERSAGTQSVIAAVADNLTTAARPKFYSIVPSGFQEDSRVYVDRLYEWNGLTEDGLPAELVGADLIRTFNDDKFQRDIEVSVTLNGPADLYLLIDKRYPVPDWLRERFKRTELEVGIDLGISYGLGDEPIPPLGLTEKRWLGRGPGVSVDVPVAVWKREMRNERSIKLGSVPGDTLPPGRGFMYGILAVAQRDG